MPRPIISSIWRKIPGGIAGWGGQAYRSTNGCPPKEKPALLPEIALPTIHSSPDLEKSPANAWGRAVAIFAARESPKVLASTLFAAIKACDTQASLIDILVNGNTSLAQQIARRTAGLNCPSSISVRIWDFPESDKAATWNHYIHSHWPTANFAFFVDGYVTAKPNAFELLENELNNHAEANCATGIPSQGRSSRKLRNEMLESPGIHGNLYALPGRIVEQLRTLPFYLPRGIYRTDAALAAALGFSLSPSFNDWDPTKLRVSAAATWGIPPYNVWSWNFWKSQWNRRFRQAQGDFENAAIRQHIAIERQSPASLATTVCDLLNQWVRREPDQAAEVARRSWRHRRVYNTLIRRQCVEIAGLPGELVKEISTQSKTAQREDAGLRNT